MPFLHRHLDPVDSLGEIVFGLIMVLTFTLGAAVVAGYERGLILEAIACNVAWGVIDGVLFVLSGRYEHRRRNRLVRAIQQAPDEATAIAAIRDELEPRLQPLTEASDRERLYQGIRALVANATPRPPAFTFEDWMAGLSVFALVVVTALPAALPFFLVHDPHLALRLSNGLLIGLLFIVGFRWARYIDISPWRAGLILTTLGVMLVAVAVALGG